jgi:predicted MFS family arabinose efflux permease
MALVAPGITLAFGWRWAIVSVLVVVIAMIIALQPMRERWDDDRTRDTQTRTSPLSGLRALWRYPMLRWLAIASLTLSFVQLCLGTFLVTMLVDEAAYTLVTAGVMLSIVQAAGVGGRILWGWLADRSRASLRVLQQLAATTAVCCIVMGFLGPEWPVPVTAVFFIVFGAAAVGWNGLFLAEVARVSPRGMVSVATSAAMTWNFAGILIGPALFATVVRLTDSYAVTYGLLSLVAFAGVAALAMCRAAGRTQ